MILLSRVWYVLVTAQTRDSGRHSVLGSFSHDIPRDPCSVGARSVYRLYMVCRERSDTKKHRSEHLGVRAAKAGTRCVKKLVSV